MLLGNKEQMKIRMDYLENISLKNKEMDTVPDSYIEQTILKLNLRPRKCLNWKTPYEVFFDKTLHLI